MGAGARMIPGGNDTMMLWSIPGLAHHGVAAYRVMMLTIAAGIVLMNLVTSKWQFALPGQNAR